MRKIILFIVEGTSDEYALSPLISRLIDQDMVKFQVQRGDITSYPHGAYRNKSIEDRLSLAIKKFLSRNTPLKKKDIEKVIFVTDTDGSFIDETYIFEDPSYRSFTYKEDGLYCKDKESALERNEIKKTNLKKIVSLEYIDDIPLEAYYFSCNLDDVLYKEKNLPSSRKEDYADDFALNYLTHPVDFLSFIFDETIAKIDEYYTSWEYLEIDNNSLKRLSNLHIFFLRNFEKLTDLAKLRIENP